MHDLSNILKRLRAKSKLTQQSVADRLSVNRQTYSNYETGIREPDINTLIKLAEVFNVSLDILVGRYVEANRTPEEKVERKKKKRVSS